MKRSVPEPGFAGGPSLIWGEYEVPFWSVECVVGFWHWISKCSSESRCYGSFRRVADGRDSLGLLGSVRRPHANEPGMIVLGDHNFRERIQSGFWVIDFWSPSCAPCRVVTPILEELSQELPELHFGSVDATTELQTRFTFQVSGFPTVVLLKDGRPIDLIFGPYPAKVYRDRIAAAHAAKS